MEGPGFGFGSHRSSRGLKSCSPHGRTLGRPRIDEMEMKDRSIPTFKIGKENFNPQRRTPVGRGQKRVSLVYGKTRLGSLRTLCYGVVRLRIKIGPALSGVSLKKFHFRAMITNPGTRDALTDFMFKALPSTRGSRDGAGTIASPVP